MTTTTKTRKPQNHSARLLDLGGKLPTLVLTTGKLTTFYALETLPCQFGRAAFRLTKALTGGDQGGESYDVLLDGQRSTCECLGFLKHEHCKHVESLTVLVESGKLPGGNFAKPVPAPIPDVCEFDDP